MESLPFQSSILDGSTWWAKLDRDNPAARAHGTPRDEKPKYAKVIAWERVNDVNGEENHHGLVAWLNGNHPFRSDRVTEETNRIYSLNHFTQSPPDDFDEFSWA